MLQYLWAADLYRLYLNFPKQSWRYLEVSNQLPHVWLRTFTHRHHYTIWSIDYKDGRSIIDRRSGSHHSFPEPILALSYGVVLSCTGQQYHAFNGTLVTPLRELQSFTYPGSLKFDCPNWDVNVRDYVVEFLHRHGLPSLWNSGYCSFEFKPALPMPVVQQLCLELDKLHPALRRYTYNM